MLRVLTAVDGSQPSLRAVHHPLTLAAHRKLEIHLLNVQLPLPAAAADLLDPKDVRGFHMDEGKAALQEANKIADSAGVPYESTVLVRPVAETIAS